MTPVSSCASQLDCGQTWHLVCTQETETNELRTGQSTFKGELIVPGWI